LRAALHSLLPSSIVLSASERADRNNFIDGSEVWHNAGPIQHRRSKP
jgi:hypothetical protein